MTGSPHSHPTVCRKKRGGEGRVELFPAGFPAVWDWASASSSLHFPGDRSPMWCPVHEPAPSSNGERQSAAAFWVRQPSRQPGPAAPLVLVKDGVQSHSWTRVTASQCCKAGGRWAMGSLYRYTMCKPNTKQRPLGRSGLDNRELDGRPGWLAPRPLLREAPIFIGAASGSLDWGSERME